MTDVTAPRSRGRALGVGRWAPHGKLESRPGLGVRSGFVLSRYLGPSRRPRGRGPVPAPRTTPAAPSLVSSISGSIEKLFLALPWWLFEAERDRGRAVKKLAEVVLGLLRTLPATTRFVVLINRQSRPRAEDWLRAAGVRRRTRIVEAPDSRRFTLWAEDHFAAGYEGPGRTPWIIASEAMTRLDDPEVASRVARRLTYPVRSVPFALPGGNALVGDDFWLVGADERVAAGRGYREGLESGRHLVSVGCRDPLPGFETCYLERPTTVGGEPWSEVLHRGQAAGTRQPLYHIDLFVSLAGRDADGRFVLLVGDPRRAAELAGLVLPDHAMAEAFDEIAQRLTARQGFHVLRNPLPLVYVDTPGERLREWYFASSNNVLVQDAPEREVWLPSFGHAPWPELAATDEANAAMWRDLGYRVHLLPDCHALAYCLGGPNCIKKVLRRRSLPTDAAFAPASVLSPTNRT